MLNIKPVSITDTWNQFKSDPKHQISTMSIFVDKSKTPKEKIDDCIRLYCRESYVSSCTFEIKCQCNQFKYAPIVCTKKELLNTPNVLILKLDRGDVTPYKTNHIVRFKKDLKSKCLLNETYKLFGVCYHKGNNDGGHYKEWYLFNDKDVKRLSLNDVRDDSNAMCANAMFLCFAK